MQKFDIASLVSVSSADIQRIILQSGWFPERHIDVQEYMQALEAEGFETSSDIRAFFETFGGLTLKWDTTRQPIGLHKRADFDPICGRSRPIFEPAELEEFMQIAQEPLCPVGVIDGGYETLMMNKDGRVYGRSYEALVIYGENCVQSIQSMISESNIFIIRDAYGSIVEKWFRKE